MTRTNDAALLKEIVDSSRKAIDLTFRKSRADLNTDKITGFALVRLLEIIGEAAGGLSKGLRDEFPNIPWSVMEKASNRLLYSRFDINYEMVWETVARDLPPLLPQMEKVMDEKHPGNNSKIKAGTGSKKNRRNSSG